MAGWDGGIMGWNPSTQVLIRVHFHDLRTISVTPNGGKEPRGWDYRIGIGIRGSGRGLWDYRGYYGMSGWDGGFMGWHSAYGLLIRVHFCGLRPISVTPNGEEEPRGWDYRG